MPAENDLILRAARGEYTERIPVWVMRQAGRILPEYRRLRAEVRHFKELIRTPSLACEATLQPLDHLGVDAAILFSDILVLPEAMGLPYGMSAGKGPLFKKTIENSNDIQALSIAEADDLRYVLDSIALVKKAIRHRVPLIGFAGAPWTIFAYMTEGRGSKTFSVSRKMLYSDPLLAHRLLEKITISTINYLKAQIEAGADLIQLFDSWAGILPLGQYLEFGKRYLGMICETINEVPIIIFAKGAYLAFEEIARLNCRVIGLDWNMDISASRQQAGPGKTLQGNADPCLLYAADDVIIEKTKKMIADFGTSRYIANLGHGVYPDTSVDKVKLFVQTVQQYKY